MSSDSSITTTGAPRRDAEPVLFVTGMQRAGTTLIEKLLASHPDLCVLSQPSPLLFVELKRRFLRARGSDDPYPLGSLFLERRYRHEEWRAHLESQTVDPAEVTAIVRGMQGFTGQYTPVDGARLERAWAGRPARGLAALLAALYREWGHAPRARVFGAKETLCEEYLPYLLGQGARAVLILRDPRDVLASLNHGRGPAIGGSAKPTLFNLRNWRKSVAFALHLQGLPGFAWLRYEDLVARPRATLDRLTARLGLPPLQASAFEHGLRDQRGGVWHGNSSHRLHDGLTAASVGSYKSHLATAVARYTEAACYAELRALGYETSLPRETLRDVLASFEDPYPVARPELAEYARDPLHRAAELERLERLERPADEHSRHYFLFPEAHSSLRAALG